MGQAVGQWHCPTVTWLYWPGRSSTDAIPSWISRSFQQNPIDPYRLGLAAWTVSAVGGRRYLRADMTAEEALARLTADLGGPMT